MRLFKRTRAAFLQVAQQRFADEHYEKHLLETRYQRLVTRHTKAVWCQMIGRRIKMGKPIKHTFAKADNPMFSEGPSVFLPLKFEQSTKTLPKDTDGQAPTGKKKPTKKPDDDK